MKKLNLNREVLTELTIENLRLVAGGLNESRTCTPTYTCVNVSEGNCLSGGDCFNATQGCTAIDLGRFGLC